MVDIITKLDLQLLHKIHEFTTPELDIFFKYFTKVVSLKYIVPLLLLFIIYQRTRKYGLHILVSGLLQIAIGTYFLKPLIARARPFFIDPSIQLIIKAPKGFSWPSGHSGLAFAFAFAIFFSDCPKYLKVLSLIFAALVGFSRLYLQVHFPTDVLSGAVLGFLCGYFGKFILDKFDNENAA